MSKSLLLSTLNQMTSVKDDGNLYTKADFEVYLLNSSAYQLCMFLARELSLEPTQLYKYFTPEQVAHLLSFVDLNEDERKRLSIDKRQKAIAIGQMSHVVTSSVIGFGSGVLGFLALSSNFVAGAILGIAGFSILPIAISIRFTLNLFSKQEKIIFQEQLFNKFKLVIIQTAQKKLNAEMQMQLADADQLMQKLLGKTKLAKLKSEFKYEEELYTTHTGLRRVKQCLKAKYDRLNPAVDLIIAKIKKIKDSIKTPDGLTKEYFSDKKAADTQEISEQSDAAQDFILRPDPIEPKLNIPKPTLGFIE